MVARVFTTEDKHCVFFYLYWSLCICHECTRNDSWQEISWFHHHCYLVFTVWATFSSISENKQLISFWQHRTIVIQNSLSQEMCCVVTDVRSGTTAHPALFNWITTAVDDDGKLDFWWIFILCFASWLKVSELLRLWISDMQCFGFSLPLWFFFYCWIRISNCSMRN